MVHHLAQLCWVPSQPLSQAILQFIGAGVDQHSVVHAHLCIAHFRIQALDLREKRCAGNSQRRFNKV